MKQELNGARALTPAQMPAQHPQEDAAARTKQAEAEAARRLQALQQAVAADPGLDVLRALELTGEPDGLEEAVETPVQSVLNRAAGATAAERLGRVQAALADLKPMDEIDIPFDEVDDDEAWLLPQWLPEASVGLLSGEGGVGKSRLALQIAYDLAGGGPGLALAGLPRDADLDAVSVAYAGYEDKPKQVTRRLKWIERALAQREGRPGAKRKPSPLHVMNGLRLRRTGPLWGRADPLQAAGRQPAWHAVTGFAEAHRARLLIIDPLAAAYTDNENDRGAVRRFMNALNAWAEDVGCAVLIVSHPPKSAAAYSGSTDWHAASRFVWTLNPADDPDPDGNRVELAMVKSNYGLMPEPLAMANQSGVWHRDQELSTKADVAEATKAGKAQIGKASGEVAGTDTSHRETLYEAGGFE